MSLKCCDENGGAFKKRTKRVLTKSCVETKPQQNKTYFDKPKEKGNVHIVRQILDDIVCESCSSPQSIIQDLLDSLLSSVNFDGDETRTYMRAKHDGLRVSSTTFCEWKNKYPWLKFTEDDGMKMFCETCQSMKFRLI